MLASHFRAFANCIPVKGAQRSLICDIQRNTFHFIPNDLYEIVTAHATKSIGEIIDAYGRDNAETIEEYFQFLLNEQYIFLCEEEELALFPDINLQWEHPATITNAIIDVGAQSRHNFKAIFGQLEELGCQDVQIRFFSEKSLPAVSEIVRLLDYSTIKSLDLYLKYYEGLETSEIHAFTEISTRMVNIIFHSAPFNKILEHPLKPVTPVAFRTEAITDASHCGFVHPDYFTINLSMFSEAQGHNTCLNRKISIDERGEIKNCPSMRQSYGNIAVTPLAEVVKEDRFKSVWGIHKDQVEICKDCEFRYICTDCRAFLKDANNIFSKPLKCSYNPYTNVWED